MNAGNDFFRMEFHYLMPIVLFGVAASHHSAVELLVYTLSLLYLLYGTVTQLDVMKSNIINIERTPTPTNQEEAWGFLYDFMITWISSVVFCVLSMRHWWKNEFTSYVTMEKLDKISWLCIPNAVTAAVGTSSLEFWFASSISSDLGILPYFCLSVLLKGLLAIYQGMDIVYLR